MGFDDRTTYITERTDRTGSTRSRRSKGHGLGALATAGAAGAGLAALRNRSRSRSRTRRNDSRSRVESQFTESYLSDEKYAPKKTGTWKEKLLGAGAAAGGIFAVKSLFNRNKKRAPTEYTESDVSYTRPLGRSEVTQTDLSRLEEGRAPASPANHRDDWRRVEEREAAQAAAMAGSPLRHGRRPGSRRTASVDSFDSRTSFSDEHDGRAPGRSFGLKEGVATLGVIGFLKHSMSKRKTKKEDERVEALRQQDIEEERMARANSQRKKYTGDGAGPRRSNRPPSTILSESDFTGITPSVARPNIARPPPVESTAGPSTAPIRPPPHDIYSESGSEAYLSGGGRSHRRHHSAANAALAGGAAAAALSTGSPSKRDPRSEASVASPPVSVKVKMHNDGRHVTLRRLNEEEAAAEREARRKERQKRNRNGSRSSLSDLGNDRWRRTEAMEAAQAQEMAHASSSIPPPPPGPPPALRMPEPVIPPPPPGPPPMMSSAPGNIPLPPPPPIPAAANSVLSSPHGTQIYGTETDLSGAYDSNRRRRRAERAQAKQARMGGSRVEFS